MCRLSCPGCGLLGHGKYNWAIIAPWVAELGDEKLGPSKYRICTRCGLGWSDINYSENVLKGIYSEYRGKRYLQVRNSWEPTYSEELNRSLDFGDGFLKTRRDFITTLISEIDKNFIESASGVVDIGGGHGGVMPNWPNLENKFVLEISNAEPAEGIESITDFSDIPSNQSIDLIMCCGILEHLNSPTDFLTDLANKTRNMKSNSCRYYYFEVPNGAPKYRNNGLLPVLLIASHFKLLWRVYDKFIKRVTGSNFPIRIAEHIQFFEVQSLEYLLTANGFKVLSSSSYESLNDLPGARSLNFQSGLAIVAKIN